MSRRSLAKPEAKLKHLHLDRAAGMILSDHTFGGRFAFIYPHGTTALHDQGQILNILHFDGRVSHLPPEKFWPNIMPGDWRSSAMWRPIQEGVTKTW